MTETENESTAFPEIKPIDAGPAGVWKSTKHHRVLLPLAADLTCRDSGIP